MHQRCLCGMLDCAPRLEILDRTVNAAEVHRGHRRVERRFKTKKEKPAVSGGALDTEGLEENVQELYRYKDHGTAVVLQITDVRYSAFKGMAKVCRDVGLEDEDIPQRTT